MYQDLCLLCGKPVDASCLYCCAECERLESAPFSGSTSSSDPDRTTRSGAQRTVTDVSAFLNTALRTSAARSRPHRHGRKRSSLSSSSVSSALSTPSVPPLADNDDAWSELDQDTLDLHHSDSAKAPFSVDSVVSGLSYARRPSATNTRSTIPVPLPLPDRSSRTSSTGNSLSGSRSESCSSSHRNLHSAPGAFAQYSFNDNLDENKNYAAELCPHSPSSGRRRPIGRPVSVKSTKRHKEQPSPDTMRATKSKHQRARTSLPAYFSLLQVGLAPLTAPRISPVAAAQSASVSPTSTLKRATSSASPTTSLSLTPVTSFRRVAQAEDELYRGRVNRIDRNRLASRSRSRSRSRSKSRGRRRMEWIPANPEVANMSVDLSRGRPRARRNFPSRERLVSTEPQLDYGLGVGSGLDGLGGFGLGGERGRTESRGRSRLHREFFDPRRVPQDTAEAMRGRRREVVMR